MFRALVSVLALLRASAVIHVGRGRSASHRELEIVVCRTLGPNIISTANAFQVQGTGGQTAAGTYTVTGNSSLVPTADSQDFGRSGYYSNTGGSGYYAFSFALTASVIGQNFRSAIILNGNQGEVNSSVAAPVPGDLTTVTRLVYVNTSIINGNPPLSEGLGIIFNTNGPDGSAVVGNITLQECTNVSVSTEPTTPATLNSQLGNAATSTDGGYVFSGVDVQVNLTEPGPYTLAASIVLTNGASFTITALPGTVINMPNGVNFQVGPGSTLTVSNVIFQYGTTAMVAEVPIIYDNNANKAAFFVNNGSLLIANAEVRGFPQSSAPGKQIFAINGAAVAIENSAFTAPGAVPRRDRALQTVNCSFALIFGQLSTITFTGRNVINTVSGFCALAGVDSTLISNNPVCTPPTVVNVLFGFVNSIFTFATFEFEVGCTSNGTDVTPTPAPTPAPSSATPQLLKLRIRTSEEVLSCSNGDDEFKLTVKITNDNTFRVDGVLLRVRVPSRYLRLEGADSLYEQESTDVDFITLVFRNVSVAAEGFRKFKLRFGVNCERHSHHVHSHNSDHHHHHHSHERMLYYKPHGGSKRTLVLVAEALYTAGAIGPVTIKEEETLYIRN